MRECAKQMGWFGLFDALRFRPDSSEADGWALPASRLRLTERNLAAFYHGAVSAVGGGFRADLYDLAAHHLACSTPAAPGAFHVDLRMIGRAAPLLFSPDAAQAVLSWHEASRTGRLRLAGTREPVLLGRANLANLLEQAAPIERIATLSVWIDDAAGFERVMKLLNPWLASDTRAIVRIPGLAFDAFMRRLPAWPVRAAAVVPCSGAAERDGTEALDDLLVCFDTVSPQPESMAVARSRAALRPVRASTWNDQNRAWRSGRQGDVSPIPAQGATPAAGPGVMLVGELPARPAAAAFAAMVASPYCASTGFDSLLDIHAARVVAAGGVLFAVPHEGPVVIDPAALPVDATTADVARLLASCGVAGEAGMFLPHCPPVQSISERPALLLGGPRSALAYVGEAWPNLEHLFQLCEREQLDPGDIDVLIPGVDQPWILDSLRLVGIAPERVRRDVEGVLFRRLLVAGQASNGRAAQRSEIYDAFWARLGALQPAVGYVSFSQRPPSRRLLLSDPLEHPQINGTELEAIARERGYRVVTPRLLGLAELVDVLGTAQAIVGPSALLGWSALASGCAIGLLHADTSETLPHAALHAAAARGHSVAALFGTTVGAAGASGFVVAPDRFAGLLERVEIDIRPLRAEMVR